MHRKVVNIFKSPTENEETVEHKSFDIYKLMKSEMRNSGQAVDVKHALYMFHTVSLSTSCLRLPSGKLLSD